jgi:hypothetical protein
MQNFEFRDMQHLLRRKIITVVALLFCSNVFSQFRDQVNLEDHDDKPYHFGINLGYNTSHFQFTHHPYFLQRDTIMDVESVNADGINLAWLVNFRISEHFDLRLHPLDLTFTEKSFLYKENYIGATTTLTEKKVQSITLSFPMHIKFSSDRIENFKVYMLGGTTLAYDLASNAGAKRAEDLIKLRKGDMSVDLGLGFHFYFPVFVLTPEIKISNGIRNLHARDDNLRYSNVIDKINSKIITFSLTVE